MSIPLYSSLTTSLPQNPSLENSLIALSIFLTRYPITNHLGSVPSKLNVSSTVRTEKMYYKGELFKFYPIVDLNMTPTEVSTFFFDVLKLSNVLLKAFGGDYKLSPL